VRERDLSVFSKKPGLNRKAGPPVHDDPVDRVFTADAPDVAWLTDFTEQRTAEGVLHLRAIKDVCFGRIVGNSSWPLPRARPSHPTSRLNSGQSRALRERGPVALG
jgi:transposase InsO family protein